MIDTFASELEKFSLAVDSIYEGELLSIQTSIKSHLKDILKIERAEFFLVGTVSRKPGLKPQWNKEDRDGEMKIGDSEVPKGHCGYCFYNHKPLWITAKDDEVLDQSTIFVDHWSNSSGLPVFTKTNYTGFKTEIIIPVLNNTGVFSVLYLGSKERLLPNKRAKAELEILAEAYGRLFRLEQTHKYRDKNIITAMHNMIKQTNDHKEFILKKPIIFFAYPKKADPEVLSTIIEVLSNYQSDFEVIRWGNQSFSGSITQQLIKDIKNAKCGICYFSEPYDNDSAKGKYGYFDNSNVLIEAGMLHALCNEPLAEPVNWIPIREKEDNSGPIPFDFATDSFVLINRKPDFSPHNLTAELKKRLDEIKNRLQ